MTRRYYVFDVVSGQDVCDKALIQRFTHLLDFYQEEQSLGMKLLFLDILLPISICFSNINHQCVHQYVRFSVSSCSWTVVSMKLIVLQQIFT